MRNSLSRETLFIYTLTGCYLLFFPYFFGSASFSLPLIPAAFVATQEKSRFRFSQIFVLGVMGDLLFSNFAFGLFTVLLMLGSWSLRLLKQLFYVESIFSLALYTACLSLTIHLLELVYLTLFVDLKTASCLFQKEFLFDPIKLGFLALFGFTLPLLAVLPKEDRRLKIFSLKG